MDAHLGQRTRLHLLTGGTTYADVLRVQAVLAPGRRDAVVEVGAGPSHVQLLLVRLGGDVVPGLGPLGQELIKRRRERSSRWQQTASREEKRLDFFKYRAPCSGLKDV